jgi:hypothetical protein
MASAPITLEHKFMPIAIHLLKSSDSSTFVDEEDYLCLLTEVTITIAPVKQIRMFMISALSSFSLRIKKASRIVINGFRFYSAEKTPIFIY